MPRTTGQTADSSRLVRWSRWGVLGAAILMAVALVTTSWLGYSNARGSSWIVARGQGVAIVEGVIGRLRAVSPPPSEADLQEIREALDASGLRYLALLGRRPVRAGRALGSEGGESPRALEGERIGLSRAGERMRMVVRLPPPRPRGRLPDGLGDGRPPGDGPPRGGPPRGGPSLVIEFEPGPANELVARARTSLILSASVACGILIAAMIGFVWLRRHERGELQRARERHLASLGEMSAVLAHELRNPLTSLKGHAQLLAESLEGDQPKQDKANRVVREAMRLETLTTDLLDFVRTGQIRRSASSPAELLRTAAQQVDGSRIALHETSAPQRWSMDADRMQQALENLLRNAVQAADDGAVDASVAVEHGRLVYEIRDHGPGIATAELERIFQPFHTTRTRGTGLGLAVARRVVELHGGRLSAHNHPQGGAVFRIEIPEVS